MSPVRRSISNLWIGNKQAFTLIELLIVIGILGILAAVVLVAINPTKQLAESRNAGRRADVKTIMNAIQQYVIDNGSLPAGVDTTLKMIGTDVSGCDFACATGTAASACVDLTAALVPAHTAGIPGDPRYATGATKTYYAVNTLSNGRLRVQACRPELNATIMVEQ